MSIASALRVGWWVLAWAALVVGCAGPPVLEARPPSSAREDAASAGVSETSRFFEGAGGIAIFVRSWRPRGEVRATVVIHHGLESHSAHYAELAAQLVARGFAVEALDMRGHGRSAGRRASIDDFDDLLADLDQVVDHARAGAPDRPLFLLGHSVGGAVVTLYALERRRPLAGIVLLAPALRVDRLPIEAAATPIAAALFPNLPAVDVPNEFFSRSPATRADMAADPLVYQPPGPARTAAAVIDALERIWSRAPDLDVPLLALHGTSDRATDPRGSAELVRRAHSSDRTLLLYRGLFHDLVREPEHAQVEEDIGRWLEARSPRSHAPRE